MKKRHNLPRYISPILWGGWGVLIATAYIYAMQYSDTEGDRGTPPTAWIQTSSIQRNTNKHTLLFFIHPECPCTAASIAEYRSISPRLPKEVECFAVVLMPNNANERLKWQQSSLYQALEALPNIRLVEDIGGDEMRRFGATTSGVIGLFSNTGKLLFWGGITRSRGHVGTNPAEELLIKTAWEQLPETLQQTAVYGCSLLQPDSCRHTIGTK